MVNFITVMNANRHFGPTPGLENYDTVIVTVTVTVDFTPP